ncbi:hypothetical protein FDP41_009963 [Naegleria fowleri]|uniref:Uncharacterized protein n=1 Tax=Naegleria fowleri TaxID=5763 RepID=A0A6A5BCC7_NAEFO|nr:uncharacterized protein FDP41_009963 [Naegleria fowleri]KAF0971740.1 hypothetical protein FDP41_009963 [Naegleria fowleri]
MCAPYSTFVLKRRHETPFFPDTSLMIGRSSVDSATGRVSLDALASTTQTNAIFTNRSIVLNSSASLFVSTAQNMMLHHDRSAEVPESVHLPVASSSSTTNCCSDMESLSSDASVSSVGELYYDEDEESFNQQQTRISMDQTRITTLSPLQNCFNFVATNLVENDSDDYPGTLPMSVHEDGEYLQSFYSDSFCRPFKIRVRISALSQKLPKGIYTDLVDSMTLLTIVKPYSVFSTNAIVKEGTQNQFIGTISKDFIVSNFKVKSSKNTLLFKILHEKTKSETLHFYSIHNATKKEKIGKIISKKSQEFFLDIPPNLTPEEKSLLIGSLMLIVFTLHEDKKSKEFFQKNAKQKTNYKGVQGETLNARNL